MAETRLGGHLAIRAPNWVGDLVMSTPVLATALESPQWTRVTILLRRHLAGVLADGPWADSVTLIEDSADEFDALKRLAPDAVLLLTNSFSAAWRAFVARVPVRAGATLSGRRLLLTHALCPPVRAGRRAPIPTAHLMRDVAGLVGLLPDSLHPRLGVRAEIAADVAADVAAGLRQRGADPARGYALCSPGAAFGAAKLWPPESYARVLDAIHERHGWSGVVTGGPGEEALVERVVQRCRHAALSLAGERRDLERLKALVRESRLLVVGDSGPRWYAAAFDVPCVTVMGPNFPELTASSLELCEVVRHTGLECAPCLNRTCPLPDHRCMRELSPGRVLQAVERVLARAPRPARAAPPARRAAVGGAP